MPFGPAYTRTKTFIAGGTLLPADLNSIQDDLGVQIEKYASEDIVSTLPTVGLVDGQVCNYQNAAMLALGVAWRFRYRSGSASPYKWEFIGGFPHHVVDSSNNTFVAGGTWVDPGANPGPSITFPLTGEYEWTLGANIFVTAQSAASVVGAALGINGTQPTGDRAATGYTASGVAINVNAWSVMVRSAGDVAKLMYNVPVSAGGTPNVRNRTVKIRPIRVI